MKTRAAVFFGAGQPFEVRELELDEPRAGEVLVRMAAVGICGTDLHSVKGEWVRPTPTVLGHEGAGVVEAVGEGVSSLAVGDHVIEKTRMSGWQGTRLDNLFRALGVDTVVVTGAWTNMSIEHTARTGADMGYRMVVPEDCCSTMNADWHNAAINFALQNVSTVTSSGEVVEALG